MIETYEIISGLEDVNSTQFFIRSSINNLGKVIRMEFFSQRVIDQWNGQPEEVVTVITLNSFKLCPPRLFKNR